MGSSFSFPFCCMLFSVMAKLVLQQVEEWMDNGVKLHSPPVMNTIRHESIVEVLCGRLYLHLAESALHNVFDFGGCFCYPSSFLVFYLFDVASVNESAFWSELIL